MYDYKNIDYYNYINNNYNQPSYSKNKAQLYDPYNGYLRGNMFPDLYNGYKLTNPVEINPQNEKEALLLKGNMYAFAAHDINLYLDLNPNDREMIMLYNQYKNEAENILNDYQNKYGPLSVYSNATNSCPWSWNNNPWPWE